MNDGDYSLRIVFVLMVLSVSSMIGIGFAIGRYTAPEKLIILNACEEK